jgi:crotonobetainyl-CoA:carnitine CoA-transferase CaiB-like acyl-CoA transferase
VVEAAEWGLLALTGRPGEPTLPAAPVATRVRALCDAIDLVTGTPGVVDPAWALVHRARLHGWRRGGRVSANGSCRLLRAADGWLAVSLSRADDLDSLPALLGRPLPGPPWASLAAAAATRPAAELAADAQVLGIPAAVLGADSGRAPLRITAHRPGPVVAGRVLDLSAMWAGPLCARILGRVGSAVVKVEDVHRPDGMRAGQPEFYAELHRGHTEVVLDFADPAGRDELRRLAGAADVVLESSRPRALRALGLVAEEWLAERPGRTWVSITGYGRDDPAQRVAFGDDAAVAGGLVAHCGGEPVFCGDAIADPLTGLYAGLAACASRAAGGGHLIDVAMAGVAADVGRPADGAVHEHVVDGDTARHRP